MSNPTVPWCDAACRTADLPGCVATGTVLGTLPTQAYRGRGAPAWGHSVRTMNEGRGRTSRAHGLFVAAPPRRERRV